MKIQRIINGTFEDEVALIDIETNEILLKGDAYHDKIDEQIEGFLLGLLYCNFKHSLLEDKTIMPTDKLFDICEFSNEDYSDYDNDDDEEEEGDILLEDLDGDERIDNIIKELKLEITPYLINHRFEIDSCERTFSFFGNIVEALAKVKDYEGDLYLVESGMHYIVYSCQGLELEDNNDGLKKFGVFHEEDSDGWLELKIIRDKIDE